MSWVAILAAAAENPKGYNKRLDNTAKDWKLGKYNNTNREYQTRLDRVN